MICLLKKYIRMTKFKLFVDKVFLLNILYALICIYQYIREKYALLFKALSDKTRLRIINLLINTEQPLCLCELVDALDEPQYKISKHLKGLKYGSLIEEKKIGRCVYYLLLSTRDNFNWI